MRILLLWRAFYTQTRAHTHIQYQVANVWVKYDFRLSLTSWTEILGTNFDKLQLSYLWGKIIFCSETVSLGHFIRTSISIFLCTVYCQNLTQFSWIPCATLLVPLKWKWFVKYSLKDAAKRITLCQKVPWAKKSFKLHLAAGFCCQNSFRNVADSYGYRFLLTVNGNIAVDVVDVTHLTWLHHFRTCSKKKFSFTVGNNNWEDSNSNQFESFKRKIMSKRLTVVFSSLFPINFNGYRVLWMQPEISISINVVYMFIIIIIIV